MHVEFTPAEIARFWSHTRRIGDCLLWMGAQDGKGYGVVRLRGRPWRVHRLAWIIRHGCIPEGMCVCHRCDVRNCVEDAHHFLGTRVDNNRDMETKGRSRKVTGEQHHRAKLTAADVIEIRRIYPTIQSYHRLAERFGVHWSTIQDVVRHRHWRHVS